jgi:hypothetical protein
MARGCNPKLGLSTEFPESRPNTTTACLATHSLLHTVPTPPTRVSSRRGKKVCFFFTLLLCLTHPPGRHCGRWALTCAHLARVDVEQGSVTATCPTRSTPNMAQHPPRSVGTGYLPTHTVRLTPAARPMHPTPATAQHSQRAMGTGYLPTHAMHLMPATRPTPATRLRHSEQKKTTIK